ncbi:glycosyltransferase [Allosphingosinicella indica]|uniref:Glycosyltransferase involved in cell wall bisynthesis n=1 Tax=Allosphingosinicella indica TaxID=941907 RepID=A0A1X7G218_9SPHN|nr:glycosyltransferase [Allosphingosinicella indica]SMF62432.1 Glycosyltransferase involved in cell wall bisynthesis [Allosphingosinicella indica]
MLRVLTLATLFPNAAQPVLGVFVERQTIGLAALPETQVRVVAPIGLPPWPLSRHPHYAPLAALPEREMWKGLQVHRPRFRVWPLIGDAAKPAALARALLPLLRDMRREFPFDVIDAEFFWPDGPTAMLLSETLGVPFSVKARGADIHLWGRRPATAGAVRQAADAADGLLAVSEGLKADMIALGMPAERIRIHYTGIDLEAFGPVDRDTAKAALGVAGPLIATAGALIPRKNQIAALEVLTRIPDATLLLIGDGPDRAMLESKAAMLGVADRARFLGRLPHEELPVLLAAADVMLLPSRSEGLANVWVEALACGTPVVAGDIPGAREAIDRLAAGRLTSLDADALTEAVRAILADPPDQAGVRAAAERFSWDRNAYELRAHLEAVSRSASALPRSSVPRS